MKPRALAGIRPLARIIVVLLGLCGWALIAFGVYVVVTGELWNAAKALYPYDLIVVLGAVLLALCIPEPDKVDGKRRWVIPK